MIIEDTLNPWNLATDGIFCDNWGQATDGVFCSFERVVGMYPSYAEKPKRNRDKRDMKDINDLLMIYRLYLAQ